MRTLLTATAVCLSIVSFSMASDADASISRATSIPAQGLGTALQAFAKDREIHIVFVSEDVDSLETQGVTGMLTVDGALQQLLNGTGLTYRYLDDTTVSILPIATAPASSSAAPGLRPTASQVGEDSLSEDRPRFFWRRFRLAQADQKEPAQTQSESAPQQVALEEVVVTAERREETAQSLPIAISAFSGETLTERGIEGLESLSQLASSLQVLNRGAANDTRVAMRGVSNELELIGEPPVDLAWDGVSYASSQLFAGDFFDVDRVEVLRGPQGTISGRNATAGAIKIYSKRPTEEFDGGIKATLGNYDRWGIEGHLNGPIVGERLLARLAVRTDRADGWATNTLLGQELGRIDNVQARASFLAHLTDDFEAHLILEGLRDQSNHLVNVFVDKGRLRPDTPTLTEALGISSFDEDSNTFQVSNRTIQDKDRYQATLRLTWELGPSAQLTAVTGYVDQTVRNDHDNDGTAEALIVHNRTALDARQMSQEATLTMDLTERLDLILGGLYLDFDQPTFVDLAVPPVSVAVAQTEDRKLTSWAGYTQWRYRLTDDLRLTAGMRYTHDTKDFGLTGLLFIGNPPSLEIPLNDHNDDSWSAWTPRFAVDYQPSDDLTLYASVSRGFKSGGVSSTSSFEPEFVWNYEAGVKANGWDGRVKTALTAFFMDYTDLQQLLFFFDTDQGLIRGDFVNAKSATNKGVELEVDALVTDQLRITFAGTWLDATFGELRNHDTLFPELGAPLPEAPDGLNFRDLAGNRVVRAPEWQFNLSGEYTVPLSGNWKGVLRASYAWQDQIFFDIFNRESISQGAYGLINLSGAIETTDERWQLSAFVHNLADQNYHTHEEAVIGLTSVPYAIAMIGQPRRYGISLAYRF